MQGDNQGPILIVFAVIYLTHLQMQINLWLAELHIEWGEESIAEEALSRAEERLRGSERKGLQAWARRVSRHEEVGNMPKGKRLFYKLWDNKLKERFS